MWKVLRSTPDFGRLGQLIAALGLMLPALAATSAQAENGLRIEGVPPDRGSVRVYAVAFTVDGKYMLSGGDDKQLRIWDPETGKLQMKFGGHRDRIVTVSGFPDGIRAVTAGLDGTAKVWNLFTGLLEQTLEGHDGGLTSVAFLPDGIHAVTGGLDGRVRIFNSKTGAILRTYDRHGDAVTSVAVSPDGSRVASASNDYTLHIWDTETGETVHVLRGHTHYVSSLKYFPDGRQLTSASLNGTIRLWNVISGKLVSTFAGSAQALDSVAISADGQRLVFGDSDGTLGVWEIVTGRLLMEIPAHQGWISSVAFAPDGQRILSGGVDGAIRLWTVREQHLLLDLSFIASQDGEWIALTPEGFFDASSPDASKLLRVIKGSDVYGVDQFWQALFRPDLVKEKLAGDPNGKVKEAAAKLDLDKILDSGPVPKVLIKSHKEGDTSESDLVTVAADIADQGGGIGKVEWRINGITVGVVDKPAATLKQAVALDPGENTIELVAYNGAGLVSSIPAKTTITWTGTQPTAPPRLYVLAVGINDYYEGKLKLKFGVPDATSLAEGLKEAGKELYEEVSVTLALDNDATAARLDQIFEDLKGKIRPRDVFVFYAAGHGKTEDGRYYFVPQDFKYQAGQSLAQLLVERGIGQDRLQKWFALIPAKKSIIMLDTCESGTLTGEQQIAMETRGGLEQLAAVGRLIQATGRTTLTAAMDDQSALGGYKGHGVFTFAVLDALARGDRGGNGLVEVTELLEHVDGLVPEITEKKWQVRQVPRSLFQGSNFALAKQLASLNPAPGEEMIISTAPTHVVAEIVEVLKAASVTGAVVQKLQPFTTVTLVKTEHGWALVAKDGKAIGYVAADKLHTLQ